MTKHGITLVSKPASRRWASTCAAALCAALTACAPGSGDGSGGRSGTGAKGGGTGTAGTTGAGGSGSGGEGAGGSPGTGGFGSGGATGSGGSQDGTGGATGSATGGSSGGRGGGGSGVGGRGTGGSAGAAGGSSGRGGAAGGAGASGGAGTGGATGGGGAGAGLPSRADVVATLTLANDYFMKKWPDPGKDIDSTHPSHIWTRAVYYEGLMALYEVDPQKRYYDYAVTWATSHSWGLRDGASTRSADNQCAGQTYIDLYNIDKQPNRIAQTKANIDMLVAGSKVDDWWWIDAIQMAMPIFTKLGVLTGNASYFDKMYAFYSHTKKIEGGKGMYNAAEGLWWRDKDFDPPYKEPNGQDSYWSRGNGWVYAALVRVLDILPTSDSHRAEYLADFMAMSEALRPVQRPDGFWNVSLHDPTNFGGKEITGTSLFAYGMAWGVRKGILPDATYRPTIVKAWNAMKESVHTTGFLGWVQGTGKQPSDSQPVTYDKVPNYDDFGVGCFLLGGSEVARLASP